MTIVTYRHRYKRPPRKRKAVALEVSAVVEKAGKGKVSSRSDRPEPTQPVRSAIVTILRKRGARFGDAPDLSAEEHQRRGDAADVLFRELVRRARSRT
jgi:hypothetical protein